QDAHTQRLHGEPGGVHALLRVLLPQRLGDVQPDDEADRQAQERDHEDPDDAAGDAHVDRPYRHLGLVQGAAGADVAGGHADRAEDQDDPERHPGGPASDDDRPDQRGDDQGDGAGQHGHDDPDQADD